MFSNPGGDLWPNTHSHFTQTLPWWYAEFCLIAWLPLLKTWRTRTVILHLGSTERSTVNIAKRSALSSLSSLIRRVWVVKLGKWTNSPSLSWCRCYFKEIFSLNLSKSVSEQRATTSGHEREQQGLPLLCLPGLQVGLATLGICHGLSQTCPTSESVMREYLMLAHVTTALLMCVVCIGIMLIT